MIPLDLATLPAMVHPRCAIPALHLGGSICSTATVQEEVSVAMSHQGEGSKNLITDDIVGSGNAFGTDPHMIVEHEALL